MIAKKQLWLLAGGNGSGKSTCYRMFIETRGIGFINADLIARDMAEEPEHDSYKAARLAERLCHDLLSQGLTFCFETVFSHASKIDFIAKAKSLGYEVILIYIHLGNPDLNEARVQQRVSEGGHNVPAEKIRSRIPRTMAHITRALPLVDSVRFLDNSFRHDPFRQVATIRNGRKRILTHPLPDWAREMLKDIPE